MLYNSIHMKLKNLSKWIFGDRSHSSIYLGVILTGTATRDPPGVHGAYVCQTVLSDTFKMSALC